MALEEPGKLGIFSPTLWPPCLTMVLVLVYVLSLRSWWSWSQDWSHELLV